jgi:predicted RNA-binding protein with PUA-like domain
MASFLLKTEPGTYSYLDLVREKRTSWTGVTNAAAQKWMRSIAKGDELFIYHTGDEKRIAGLARCVKGAYPDPEHPGLTAAGDPKAVLIDLAPVRAAATADATLAAMKADARLAGFELLRQPRLSVLPVPADIEAVLRTMAGL